MTPNADRDARLRALLHRAVEHAVAAAPDPVEAAAREPMCAACAAARDSGMPVERLLVQLKSAWAETPGLPRASSWGGEEILPRLVTLCINEFYVTDGSRDASRDASRRAPNAGPGRDA